MTTEESPENRAAYIEALKTEREQVTRRPDYASKKSRLAAIDAELDSYSETPTRRTRQTAAKKAAPAKATAAKGEKPADVDGDAGKGAE